MAPGCLLVPHGPGRGGQQPGHRPEEEAEAESARDPRGGEVALWRVVYQEEPWGSTCRVDQITPTMITAVATQDKE